jgi:bacillithiol synthase
MTTTHETKGTVEFPLAVYPGIGRLALDLVNGSDAASELLARPDWKTMGRDRRPSRDRSALAEGLAISNRAWGNDVAGPIGRWASGEAVAVIAGQQAGLGGGPLYTLAKIGSLLAACRRLEEGGVPAVPFFWIATEDHDFAEISNLLFQNDSAATLLRSSRSPAVREPIGALPVPEDLRRQLSELVGEEEEKEWLKPGVCFGDSFAILLARVLGQREVVLVDSLLPELRKEGAAILGGLAKRLGEAGELLYARSKTIEAAGYRPQVQPGPDGFYSLLYAIEADGERQAIVTRNDAFAIGSRRYSLADLERRLATAPETISTGALARPLLQDAVFEPALFVGGPAEVASYAQARVLHEMFGVALPAVALRGHVLVAPAKRMRALARFGIEVPELFGPLEAAVNRREEEMVGKVRDVAGEGRDSLDEIVGKLSALALEGDPGLDRAMKRSRRRIAYHFQRMADRAERAIARRDEERWAALSRLQQILYPGGQPQDRVAGWLGWWLAYGDELVDRLVEAAEPDSPTFRVVAI